MSWREFETRVAELARRAGLRDVPVSALLAVGALSVVAVCWGAWRWWPRDATPDRAVVGSLPAASIPASSASETGADASISEPTSSAILVHVVGAVRHPGVYRLAPGAHAIDAVEAAGGMLGGAVADAVNLAAEVADGEQIAIPDADDAAAIEVPAPGSVGTASGTGVGVPASGTPININTADAVALEELPGVGPSTAAKIVADREANGPFASVDDLSRVSGIGPKKLEQLKGAASVR